MDTAFLALVVLSLGLQIRAILLAMRLVRHLRGWAILLFAVGMWLMLGRRAMTLLPATLQGEIWTFVDRGIIPVLVSGSLWLFLETICRMLHPPQLGMQDDPAAVTLSHEGRVLDWNAEATAMFGYTRHEVLGRDFADLVVPVSEQERHRAALRTYVLPPETAHSVAKRLVVEARHKRGHTFPVEVTVTAVRQYNQLVFHGAIVRLYRDQGR